MLQGLLQGNFAKEALHFFKVLVILFGLNDKFLNLNVKFQNFCVNYVLGFLSKKMIGNNNGCNGFHGENGHSGKRNITVSKNIACIWIKNAMPNISLQIHVKLKYFPLFFDMVIQDNEFITKENKS